MIEETESGPVEEIDVFAEVNKAYYSYVLDRAWASDIL